MYCFIVVCALFMFLLFACFVRISDRKTCFMIVFELKIEIYSAIPYELKVGGCGLN
jgi:hypothetical protein